MESSNKFRVDLDLYSLECAGDNEYIITWSVMRALYDMIYNEEEQYCCFPQIYIPIIEHLPNDYISWGNISNRNYPGLIDALWYIFDNHYFETNELFQSLFWPHFKFVFLVRMNHNISHAA